MSSKRRGADAAEEEFVLPPVTLGGRPVHERFCSETGDFFVVAPTSEDEIRLLRHLEAEREELCIALLEANRLAAARVVEQRLERIRARMKDVEVLCRYAQSVYASVRAAHEPGFRPLPKASTSEDGDDSEQAQQRQRHQAAMARLFPAPKPDAAAFRLDESDFADTGYCIVFSCAREHPRNAEALLARAHEELERIRLHSSRASLSNGTESGATTTTIVRSPAVVSTITAHGANSLLRQRLIAATASGSNNGHLVGGDAIATPASESLVAVTPQRGGDISFLDVTQYENEQQQQRQVHVLGRAPTMKDFLTFEMNRVVALEKAEQQRAQTHERLYGNEQTRRRQQQETRDAAQHQLSFSCDGRVDQNRLTAESADLCERVRVAIETSVDRLPLARWGDENRRRGIETALMATLDSLVGVIVARNKQDAEDFFQILRRSQTLMDSESNDANDGGGNGVVVARRSAVGGTPALMRSGESDDSYHGGDDLGVTPPPAAVALSSSSSSSGTPLRFVQKKQRRHNVGTFVKTLARVIPAGGSRACSEIVKQIVRARTAEDFWSKNGKRGESAAVDEDDDAAGNGSVHRSVSANPTKQTQQAKRKKQQDTAWWMKTVGCLSIESCGVVDALQRVVTECTPFMQQRSRDIVVRGGTTDGALDAADDPRAAALCLVLDGDAGFEYTCGDVLAASAKFRDICRSYFGEVVQTFGDYAVAVFWALPPRSVQDEYELDDATTTQLPKGVPLNRLSPATRAVLAAMELHAQVKRAACAVSVAALEKRTSDDILGKEQYDLFGLRERAYTYNKMGLNTTGEYVNDRDKDARLAAHRLRYNCVAHTTPLAKVTGAAVDAAVELAMMAERVLRRPIVVSEAAAQETDNGVARLGRFSHNLVEYFTPVAVEALRLDEPPAEKLVGRYDGSTYGSGNGGLTRDDEEDDTLAVDLSRSVATGFTVARKSKRKRINFHSIHSEPVLRRLFVNLEPYRGCGYVLRSQLKEALYPLCFVDPLRVQAGAALESELAALARQKFEEFEANKYQSALARELGANGEELSPMEVMRLTLLQARKQQRQKDRETKKSQLLAQQRQLNGGGGGGDGADAATSSRPDAQSFREKMAMLDQRAKDHSSSSGGGGHGGDAGSKKSYFNAEAAIGGGAGKNKRPDRFEVQSDIHPDVLKMYKDVFGDDMIGVTHDVLDTMLRPLRNNKAAEHVTFPEFLLFAARLQAE